MKVEVKIDEKYTKTKIIISEKITDEVSTLMQRLSQAPLQRLCGFVAGYVIMWCSIYFSIKAK